MGDRDALGIGGRAGGEDNLRESGARGSGARRGSGVPGFRGSEVRWAALAGPGRGAEDLAELPHRRLEFGRNLDFDADEDRLGVDDRGDAGEQIARRAEVDWNKYDAPQETAPERDDPFDPVLGPDGDLVVRADAGRIQARRKRARGGGHFGVRRLTHPITVVMDEEEIRRRSEVLEEVEEGVAAHPAKMIQTDASGGHDEERDGPGGGAGPWRDGSGSTASNAGLHAAQERRDSDLRHRARATARFRRRRSKRRRERPAGSTSRWRTAPRSRRGWSSPQGRARPAS